MTPKQYVEKSLEIATLGRKIEDLKEASNQTRVLSCMRAELNEIARQIEDAEQKRCALMSEIRAHAKAKGWNQEKEGVHTFCPFPH